MLRRVSGTSVAEVPLGLLRERGVHPGAPGEGEQHGEAISWSVAALLADWGETDKLHDVLLVPSPALEPALSFRASPARRALPTVVQSRPGRILAECAEKPVGEATSDRVGVSTMSHRAPVAALALAALALILTVLVLTSITGVTPTAVAATPASSSVEKVAPKLTALHFRGPFVPLQVVAASGRVWVLGSRAPSSRHRLRPRGDHAGPPWRPGCTPSRPVPATSRPAAAASIS